MENIGEAMWRDFSVSDTYCWMNVCPTTFSICWVNASQSCSKVSNVRGSGTPLCAAGARVTAAYPLGPLMEGAGMNITVVSYMDSVDFGIIACERSVPDVADIALGFGAAVADLFKIALEAQEDGESQT